MPDELIALRLFKADAQEAIALHEAEYAALNAVCVAQNAALVHCSDALHSAQRAIAAYVETKTEAFQRHPPKRRNKA